MNFRFLSRSRRCCAFLRPPCTPHAAAAGGTYCGRYIGGGLLDGAHCPRVCPWCLFAADCSFGVKWRSQVGKKNALQGQKHVGRKHLTLTMQWNTGTQTSDTIHPKIHTNYFFVRKLTIKKKKRIQIAKFNIFSDCKETNSPWIEAIWSHLSKLDVSLMWICLCIGILSFDYWNLYDGDFLLYHHCYCQSTPIKRNL